MKAMINRYGVTMTFRETRYTHFFVIGLSFWNWLPTIKGPFIFILIPPTFNVEGFSFLGCTRAK